MNCFVLLIAEINWKMSLESWTDAASGIADMLLSCFVVTVLGT